MRHTLALAGCLLLMVGGALAQAAVAVKADNAQPVRTVSVPTAELSTSPVPLRALLFSPAEANSAMHPAVVMVHGICLGKLSSVAVGAADEGRRL